MVDGVGLALRHKAYGEQQQHGTDHQDLRAQSIHICKNNIHTGQFLLLCLDVLLNTDIHTTLLHILLDHLVHRALGQHLHAGAG